MNDTQGIRVSKLLAERGLCSRREADAYIERGLVFVDGQRVTQLGTRAAADAVITLAPEARATQARQATILLHKPIGYVSGQAEDGHQPAVTLIIGEDPDGRRSASASSPRTSRAWRRPGGSTSIPPDLLVLTQDGRVARQLIGDDSKVEKEYLVRVEGALDVRSLALLNHGLELDGKKLRPAKVAWANPEQLRFVLTEGRKRQIRRMCELVGLRVTGLKRVRIGRVRLGDLPLGNGATCVRGRRFERA
jgi:23S rRNA pseudouridine2604 synthase